MNFNFQRVKTPAYITSLALVVIGLLFEMGSMPVVAWILVILGLLLNIMAASVTGIDQTQRRAGGIDRSGAERSGVDPETRTVNDPRADTEEQETVQEGSSRLRRLRPVKDEKPAKQSGSSALRPTGDDVADSPAAMPAADGLRDGQPHTR